MGESINIFAPVFCLHVGKRDLSVRTRGLVAAAVGEPNVGVEICFSDAAKVSGCHVEKHRRLERWQAATPTPLDYRKWSAQYARDTISP